MKTTIQIGLILLFTVNMSFAQTKKGGPLDKKVYICEFIEEGKKKAEPIPDEIKFSGGKFQCKTLLAEGYKATAYEFSIDSSDASMPITFWADIPGEKDEILNGPLLSQEIQSKVLLQYLRRINKRRDIIFPEP